ncbi:MAG: hypothetical protein GY822_14365 [Deltaproteobacteria bacterium]|nr:hypothetical protein [Deltaproteobacteria bacterium]
MALSPVHQQKVHLFRTQHGAKSDGLLRDVQAKKKKGRVPRKNLPTPWAFQELMSWIMLQGQAKTAFQAEAGGGSAGATLRGHGHFNDDSIIITR